MGGNTQTGVSEASVIVDQILQNHKHTESMRAHGVMAKHELRDAAKAVVGSVTILQEAIDTQLKRATSSDEVLEMPELKVGGDAIDKESVTIFVENALSAKKQLEAYASMARVVVHMGGNLARVDNKRIQLLLDYVEEVDRLREGKVLGANTLRDTIRTLQEIGINTSQAAQKALLLLGEDSPLVAKDASAVAALATFRDPHISLEAKLYIYEIADYRLSNSPKTQGAAR